MLEEGELDLNGKLLYAKLEERNGVLWEIGIMKTAGRSPRDEEARKAIFLEKIYRGK